MHCLVTGGAGFIGSHVVRNLLERKYKVRVLALPSEPRNRLEGLDVEIMDGDLTNPADLDRALKGIDSVFHLAAVHAQWMPDFRPMYRVNVDGTRLLLEKSREHGVRRIVYTSTQNVIGWNPRGLSDEETPFQEFKKSSHYTKSKYLAEEEVWKFIKANASPEIVILNPSGPFGPGDTGPTGKVVQDFLRSKIPFYFYGYFNVIDVDDLSAGQILALEKGKPGQRYILAGHDVSLHQFFKLLEKHSGVKAPSLRMPRFLVYCIGYLMEKTSDWITHKAPKMTVDRVRQRGRKKLLDNSKIRDLGLEIRPIEDTIQRTVEFHRKYLAEAGNESSH
ncbi:MAG: NAD-dependent dehydratase [Leptospiraceae bacterium]|nr:NAD-dependent dehydratase [Leptospiraceae bacterium]